MAVPSNNSHLKNTTGGAFAAQAQGGTLLGNSTAGSVITNALPLKDAVDVDNRRVPTATEQTNFGARAINSGVAIVPGLGGRTAVFNQMGEGFYTMMFTADRRSGMIQNENEKAFAVNLLPTEQLFPGERQSIYEFKHDFGAKLLTKWRASEFSWTGRLADGTAIPSRQNWINAASTAAQAPATLSTTNMYDMADGDATDQAVDIAATPTRAIPGKLVMKVDFVDVAPATGGDYYNYKPITG